MKGYLYYISNQIEWFLDFCRIDRTAGAGEELLSLPSREPDRAAGNRQYNFFTKPRSERENLRIVNNILCGFIFLIAFLLLILFMVQFESGVIF